MKRCPLLILLCATLATLLLSACGKKSTHDVLKIGIARNLTHIAVGSSCRSPTAPAA